MIAHRATHVLTSSRMCFVLWTLEGSTSAAAVLACTCTCALQLLVHAGQLPAVLHNAVPLSTVGLHSIRQG